MKRLISRLLAGFCVALLAGPALAFPEKPVRIIVAFPPGGGTDALTRIISVELGKIWNQQVIVDNRPGAQGNIGTLAGVKAPPDGYTITLAHQGVLTINPYIYNNIGFDPVKDLLPITRATEQPFVLVVNPTFAARTLRDLVDMAKKQPGKLTFASSASGPQMAGEMFKLASGTSLLHVAYKGAGPAIIDLLGGQVDMMIANPASASPHVKSGKLRALVVFGKRRIEAMPEAPTAAEAGYPQLGETPEWYGYAVPVGTPQAIINKLNADFTAALKTPEAQRSIQTLGLTASPSTPEEFARQIKADNEAWGKVVKASGVKAE
jgi:tripartite-type tricarboxylate transporter receptor subunit TctC